MCQNVHGKDSICPHVLEESPRVGELSHMLGRRPETTRATMRCTRLLSLPVHVSHVPIRFSFLFLIYKRWGQHAHWWRHWVKSKVKLSKKPTKSSLVTWLYWGRLTRYDPVRVGSTDSTILARAKLGRLVSKAIRVGIGSRVRPVFDFNRSKLNSV